MTQLTSPESTSHTYSIVPSFSSACVLVSMPTSSVQELMKPKLRSFSGSPLPPFQILMALASTNIPINTVPSAANSTSAHPTSGTSATDSSSSEMLKRLSLLRRTSDPVLPSPHRRLTTSRSEDGDDRTYTTSTPVCLL